jgi:hypothetical protein
VSYICLVISCLKFNIGRLNHYSEHRKMRAKQQHVCKEINQYICIYDQYQPEMDSKFQHRMDNRSEVQEIAF